MSNTTSNATTSAGDFTNYKPHTLNPGAGWALLTTSVYCGLLIMLFPLFIAIRQWAKRQRDKKRPTKAAAPPVACLPRKREYYQPSQPILYSRRRRRRHQAQISGNFLSTTLGRLRCRRATTPCCGADGDAVEDAVDDRSTAFAVYPPVAPPQRMPSVTPYQPPTQLVAHQDSLAFESTTRHSTKGGVTTPTTVDGDGNEDDAFDATDFWTRVVDDFVVDVPVEDFSIVEKRNTKADDDTTTYIQLQGQKYEIDLCCSGPRPWTRYFWSPGFRRKVKHCARNDTECRKILRLATPFALHTTVQDVCHLLETIAVSRLLGAKAVSAYVAVEFLLTLATMVLEGVVSSLTVLCGQAVGAQQMVRVGRYVQLAVLYHQVWLVPIAILGWNFADDVSIWLGFDTETAQMALPYARYAVIAELIGVHDDALHLVLDVVKREQYSALVSGLRAASSLLLILAVFVISSGAQLWMMGVIHVVVAIAFLAINLRTILKNKWLGEDFWKGAIGSPCWNDVTTLLKFTKTALPLSLGYVVEYCEWEVLFLFASSQGPAELAVWGLLGALWDVAENIGAAFADAAEVRVAQLLGRGHPAEARYAAHKCVFMGVLSSFAIALVLFSLTGCLPRWITTDETLQSMLRDLFPQFCLGLAVLSFGTMSWSILCAQGRASLATFLCLAGTVGVTLPCAILTTAVLNFNLHGLLTSVVLGYATSGVLISFVMATTNWKKISDGLSSKHPANEKGTGVTETDDESNDSEPDYDDYDWDELPTHGACITRLCTSQQAYLVLACSHKSSRSSGVHGTKLGSGPSFQSCKQSLDRIVTERTNRGDYAWI